MDTELSALSEMICFFRPDSKSGKNKVDWSESECSRFNGSENIVGVDGASV